MTTRASAPGGTARYGATNPSADASPWALAPALDPIGPNGETPREPLPEKLYFRIGEVSRIIGVEAHVLRYWEREFKQVRPEKSQRGQRVYSRADVLKLQTIRSLLHEQGFTIAGAKKRLAVRGTGDEHTRHESATPTSPPSEPALHTAAAGGAPDFAGRPVGPGTAKSELHDFAGRPVGPGTAKSELHDFAGTAVGPGTAKSELHPPHPLAAGRESHQAVAVRREAEAAVPASAAARRAQLAVTSLSPAVRRELVALRAELSSLLAALES